MYRTDEQPRDNAPLNAWVPHFAHQWAPVGYLPEIHLVALQSSASLTFGRAAPVSRQPRLSAGNATRFADDEHQLSGAAREAVSTWPIGQAARLFRRFDPYKSAWDRIGAPPLRSPSSSGTGRSQGHRYLRDTGHTFVPVTGEPTYRALDATTGLSTPADGDLIRSAWTDTGKNRSGLVLLTHTAADFELVRTMPNPQRETSRRSPE